jgi:hypothetical protein
MASDFADLFESGLKNSQELAKALKYAASTSHHNSFEEAVFFLCDQEANQQDLRFCSGCYQGYEK